MAFTVYEYESVTPAGEPLEPPSARTVQAFGDDLQLAASTVYVAVVPDADMNFRTAAAAGTAATSADHKVLAGETRGFPVARSSRPYLYGVAA